MKIRKILLLLLVPAICAAACSKPGADKKLTVGIMPDTDSIPYIIALKNGYYKDEGIDVNFEHFKSARDRDSALQGGLLDGVITDMLAVIFANEGGIRLITPARTYGDIKLIASGDSGIKSVKDLAGKKVGLSTNTIMEYTFDMMLDAYGMSNADIGKVEIPKIPSRLEMLMGGKIDAAIMPDPLGILAVRNNGALLCSMEAMEEDIQSGIMAFTEKALSEKKAQVRAFFKCYDKAVDYLAKAPKSEYTDFIIETQGFPKELGDSFKLPAYKKAELIPKKNFDSAVRWLKDRKLIKKNHEYGSIVRSF